MATQICPHIGCYSGTCTRLTNVLDTCVQILFSHSHLWRSHQPAAVSGLEATEAVQPLSPLLAQAALSGRRRPLLLVQRQALHTAVHLGLKERRRDYQAVLWLRLSVLQSACFQANIKHLNAAAVRVWESTCLYLAEARRAGRELTDLQVVVIIGVLLLLRVHMVVAV